MMRGLLVFAVALPLSVRVFAAAPSAEDFDRASAEGAAELVLGELAGSVVAGEAPAAALRERMLADPAAYRSRAGSLAALGEFFAADARRRYAEEAAKVLERLARPRRLADAFDAGFAERAGDLAAMGDPAAVDAAYPAAFERARAEACSRQASEFVASVRPDEAEVDGSEPDTLREALTSRIAAAQARPVFEENLSYISEKLAGPLVTEAFAELKSQRASVERARPEGRAPSALAARLAEHVIAFTAERRAAAGGAHVYGVFPSVTNRLVFAAAEKLANARAAEALEAAPFPYDASAVEKAILDDVPAHSKRSDSLARLVPAAEKSVKEAAAAAFVAAAPPAERDEAADFIRRGSELGPFADRAAALVRERLVPILDPVREALAAKRLAEACPGFADGTWFPAPAAVDSLCEKPDWKGVLAGWRLTPELAPAAAALREGAELEETMAKADRFAAASLERARSARVAQFAEVNDEAAKAKMKFLAEAKEGRRPKLEEVKEFLLAAVRAAWEAAREQTLWKGAERRPVNADAHHAGLFPSVMKRIEEKAKEILAAIENPEEKPKPEDPVPAESDETPEEVEAAISFANDGARITVTLSVAGAECGSWSCRTKRGAYSEDFAKLSAGIRERFAERLVALKAGAATKIAVAVASADEFVYWGTVSGAFAALRAVAEELHVREFDASYAGER